MVDLRIRARFALSVVVVAGAAIAGASAVGQEPPVPSLSDEWVKEFQWRSIGPANMGGRIIALAVFEKDPSIYWVATASGGLLKTTNNGTTYEHQFDRETSVSIGHVAVAPSDSNVVWVGTGEANPRNSVSYGDGVYKSTDGGKTWTNMGLKESFQTGRIAIHPENPDIVYVGALGRLYGPNEERGLFKTIDGGTTWEKVLYVDDKTGVIDIDMNLSNPDVLFVATYERERDLFDTNDPSKKYGPGSAIYRTKDAGKTWEKLSSGLPTVNLGRIGLDVYRKDPNVVYAIVESERITKLAPEVGSMGINGEDAEVGARLTQIIEGGAAESAELKQGDIVIRVDETPIGSYEDLLKAIRSHKAGDEVTLEYVRERQFMVAKVKFGALEDPDRTVFPGTLGGQPENVQDVQGLDAFQSGGVYRSEDGGDSWTRVNSLNPRPMYYSQIRVDPSDDKYVYVCGTDLYKSDDGGMTFTDDGLQGGVHVDNHALWIDPNDGRHMILGCDGGWYVTYDRMASWEHENQVAIGQFYHASVDTRPLYRVYGGLQDNGTWGAPNMTRTGRGPVNSDWMSIGGGDGFIALTDPNDPDLVYSESQNGAISRRHLVTGERGFIRPQAPRGVRYRFNWDTPYILSNHNSKIFYSAGNHVFKSLDRGNNLRAISPEITRTSDGSATSLSESPRNADVVYVGTDDGAFWVTRDGGVTWSNLYGPPEEAAAEDEGAETPSDEPSTRQPAPSAQQLAMVRQMISRFDRNDDGKLQKDEIPSRMADFFDRADVNSDGVIDDADIESMTERQEPEPEMESPAADLVSGLWKARLTGSSIPDEARPFEMRLTLAASGEITGSFSSAQMSGEIYSGTFDAESGAIDLRVRVESGEMSVSGTIAEKSMSGIVEVAGGLLRVPFEATRDGRPAIEVMPISAALDDPSGEWSCRIDSDQIPPEQAEFTITLRVSADGKVTGTTASAMGSADLDGGSFNDEGGVFTFSIAMDQFQADFSGRIDGESISGTISGGGGQFEIPFTGKRTKKFEAEAPAQATQPQQPPPATPAQPAAADDPITGDWDGSFSTEQFSGEFQLTLKLGEEGKVTGSFSSRFSDADISSGRFDAETGRLTLSYESENGSGSISGTLKEGKLTGTMTMGGGNFSVNVEASRLAVQRPTPQDDAPAAPTGEGNQSNLKDLLPKPMYVSSIECSRHRNGRVYVTFDGHRSDNDDPWVFVSEDEGATWTSLRANLPRGSARVIKEDLENENLLYLGTEFGFWVSLDRGASWTRFHNNLPTVAVHDVAQHVTMNELVVATHGRSLWIVDVTPLRQMSESARTAQVTLYEPNHVIQWSGEPRRGQTGLQEFVGRNPSSGALIYYSLGEKVDDIAVSIEDFDGTTVREIDASGDAGLHRVVWDLRRVVPQPAGAGPSGRGGGRGGGRFGGGRGAPAQPGKYRVVLTVNGQRYTKAVDVVADPDVESSPLDLEEAVAREMFDRLASEPEEEQSSDGGDLIDD